MGKKIYTRVCTCMHVCACSVACAEGGVEQGNISDLLVHSPPSFLSAIYYTTVNEYMKLANSSSPQLIQANDRFSCLTHEGRRSWR